MKRISKFRLTPAMTIALIALFAALGGTAWALAKGSVKSRHIASNAVKSRHIKDGEVKGRDLAPGVKPEVLAARVYPGSSQAVGSETTLSFEGESYDTNGGIVNSTTPTVLNVPRDGIYRITGHLTWIEGGVDPAGLPPNVQCHIQLRVQGSPATSLAGSAVDGNCAGGITQEVNTALKLEQGDKISMRAGWEGTSFNLSGESRHVWLEMSFIGPDS